jgi:hypothetical protein
VRLDLLEGFVAGPQLEHIPIVGLSMPGPATLPAGAGARYRHRAP